ncbi:MAG: leucyl aminopeptidase [Deltaproteobacteria bacterium]|jgi:leucyl aminopeptidase|nr:leucyl aminopeptidase [Deltaproteobacteria bacterium]
MEIKVRHAKPLTVKTDCLILGAYEKGLQGPLLKQLNQQLSGQINDAVRAKEFSGKLNELLVLRPAAGMPAKRILLIGLGSRSALTAERLRQASGTAIQYLKGKRLNGIACALTFEIGSSLDFKGQIQAVTEGLLLAGYRFDRYLSETIRAEGVLPNVVNLVVANPKDRSEAEKHVKQATLLCQAVKLTRDLVNEPGNSKSPAWLASQAETMAAESGLKCTIFDQARLLEEKFGALLGVAQGSEREPCLIVLEHHGGSEGDPPVALVGKGVVFDTGGISLKPSEKMDQMKMDMAGGAAVIGTMMAAALLNLPINLIGVVPAVENMPSGTAIRPGDILTSLSGQTVEVLNTDAEGRLILADALTYVKAHNPRLIVDLATLTGACIIALGHQATAVLGNDQKLIRDLITAGEVCGERLWQLPLWEDYDEQIKSEVADVKNIGGRPAGTITAAAFLKKFVSGLRWAHLDIAGTAWLEDRKPYVPKGGTGVGVRLLVTFLKSLT